jgi:hypothetical protein
VVVAFWDGNSRGTRNTIVRTLNAGKRIYIYNFVTDRILTNKDNVI